MTWLWVTIYVVCWASAVVPLARWWYEDGKDGKHKSAALGMICAAFWPLVLLWLILWTITGYVGRFVR